MQIIQCFNFLFSSKFPTKKLLIFLFTISKKNTRKIFLWLMIFSLLMATFVLTVEEDREKQTENIALKMMGEVEVVVLGETSIFFYVDRQ